MMRKIVFCVVFGLALAACNRDKDNTGSLPQVEMPGLTCLKYGDPDDVNKAITINPNFADDKEILCGMRVCEVGCQCFYGCPEELLSGC